MFASKKEFFSAVQGAVGSSIEKKKELTALIHALEAKRKNTKYSDKYKREKIEPELRRLKTLFAEADGECEKSVAALCDEYRKQLIDEDTARPEELTSDINLLNASALRLNRHDLEAMLSRNSENRTMTRAILQYAERNKIDLDGLKYVGNDDNIKLIDSVPYSCQVAVKHYGVDNVYDRLIGEGSELQQLFSDDE